MIGLRCLPRLSLSCILRPSWPLPEYLCVFFATLFDCGTSTMCQIVHVVYGILPYWQLFVSLFHPSIRLFIYNSFFLIELETFALALA